MDTNELNQEVDMKHDNQYNSMRNVIIVLILLIISSLVLNIYALTRIEERDDLPIVQEDNEVKEVSTIQPENEDTEDNSITIEELERRIALAHDRIDILEFQHEVADGVITDNFVVDKITVYQLKLIDSPKISSYIDLEAQPLMNSKYKGQGLFDLPDRELKILILDVLDSIERQWEAHNRWKQDYPKFQDGTHYITFRNYEVGVMESGEFKLKGE